MSENVKRKSGRAFPLLIVTGFSGAGISSSLKTLEDMGYEVFDNFPLTLLNPLLEDKEAGKGPLAIGIDTRTRGFDPDSILSEARNIDATLVFLSADEAILQRRFTETRRRHPLAGDRPVSAGIKKEQEWLQPLQNNADIQIDTSELSIHDLRRVLEGHFSAGESAEMTVTLLSFGFKKGLPREADIIMDIRFLKNPHWVGELRPLTGRDQAVADYIGADEMAMPFFERFKAMLAPLLPRYRQEGKSYLTIAFGCTGGRHRSVYFVETLKPWLEKQGTNVNTVHRDLKD